VWIGAIFGMVFAHGGHPAEPQAPPVWMFFGMGALWLSIMSVSLCNLFLGIFYGVKAGHGEWAEYPLIGKLARRIVGV
jgi:hypothetical protein